MVYSKKEGCHYGESTKLKYYITGGGSSFAVIFVCLHFSKCVSYFVMLLVNVAL
jgi:hypothetical protein